MKFNLAIIFLTLSIKFVFSSTFNYNEKLLNNNISYIVNEGGAGQDELIPTTPKTSAVARGAKNRRTGSQVYNINGKYVKEYYFF